MADAGDVMKLLLFWIAQRLIAQDCFSKPQPCRRSRVTIPMLLAGNDIGGNFRSAFLEMSSEFKTSPCLNNHIIKSIAESLCGDRLVAVLPGYGVTLYTLLHNHPRFEQKTTKNVFEKRSSRRREKENSKLSPRLSHHRFPFLYEIGYIFGLAHYPAFLCAPRITSAAKHFRFRLCTIQIYSSLLSRNKHQKFYKTIRVSRKYEKKKQERKLFTRWEGERREEGASPQKLRLIRKFSITFVAQQ